MRDTTDRNQLAQIIERALRNMWDDTTEDAKGKPGRLVGAFGSSGRNA